MTTDLRDALRAMPKRHPRVAFQGFYPDAASWSKLADTVAPLVPFRSSYQSGLWVLDWDHRLPSRNLVLRLYAFYDEAIRTAALAALDRREDDIAGEDKFPEFDVPDFGGLPADEAYEAELEPGGKPGPLRLVSEWRREIDPAQGRKAIDVVRKSGAFQDLKRNVRRAPGLGDLEAAEWSPPCESGHQSWGIEVWYLMSFNGVVGEGRAFLVDIKTAELVKERDFQFRAG